MLIDLSKRTSTRLIQVLRKLCKDICTLMPSVAIYRAELWSDVEDDDLVHVNIGVTDENGAWKKFRITMNLNNGEIATVRACYNVLGSGSAVKKLSSALTTFLIELTNLNFDFAIERLYFDIAESYSYTPDVEIKKCEDSEDSYNMYVKYYPESYKDDWGIRDSSAVKILGKGLASF